MSNFKSKQKNIYFNESTDLLVFTKIKLNNWKDKILLNIAAYVEEFSTFTQPSKKQRFKFLKKYINFNKSVTSFLALYHQLCLRNFFKFFRFISQYKYTSEFGLYNIYFNFRGNRLFTSVLNSNKRLYITLSVGLFLKFFQNKKSLKKNKLFKLLLAKYLRKLLIVSGIKNIYVYIKKTPLFVQEIFHLLTSPLVKPFFNPIKGLDVLESPSKHHSLNIRYVFFQNTKSFTSMKVARKGRLKRKIQKRIIKNNKIQD